MDGAGHEFHGTGIGVDGGTQGGQVAADMILGLGREAHFELLEAIAENVVKLIGREVLEDERVVKLIDAGLGELLRHIHVRGVQLGQN